MREPALLFAICIAQAHLSSGACQAGTSCSRVAANEDDPVSLLQTQVMATQRSGSSAAVSLGPHYGYGEEGEVFETQSVPALQKVDFPSMSEAGLKGEVEMIQKQDAIDEQTQATREALDKLKAETYHDASMSAWRFQDETELQSEKRRVQRLAELNEEKHAIVAKSAKEAKDDAYYEKVLHLSTEAAAREKARALKAHEEEMKNVDLLEKEKIAWKTKAYLDPIKDDLNKNRRIVEKWEAEELAHVANGVESVGLPDLEKGMPTGAAQRGANDFDAALQDFHMREKLGPNAALPKSKAASLLDTSHKAAARGASKAKDIMDDEEESEAECYEGCAPNCPSHCGMQPKHQSCTPKCAWECQTQQCDEVCAPVCEAPKCQTRCKSFDTSACHMECDTPHCAVICPKRGCPSQNCPLCKTQCGKPMCKMRCKEKTQPCQSVCEQPRCKWQCKAPSSCPKPKCKMLCQTPKNCMGNTYRKLPPLKPGEIAVKSFVPQLVKKKSSSLQTIADEESMTVPVSMLQMSASGKHQTRQIELPRVSARRPM